MPLVPLLIGGGVLWGSGALVGSSLGYTAADGTKYLSAGVVAVGVIVLVLAFLYFRKKGAL
ncbi:hypothetical protein IFO68_10785 [Photobacterium sp. CAU 1568]|uniref:GlsB/YeaQ/YmgE family stress response membrane protein n=1 Tax=Photobacterium arenosum TaxID=2774143 RepID=A0ABR9BKT5_9GAMM|nr:hypothetical protein [Photobacterium arenosum]MBD8513159.1 hypothetical protein [Photobacterium arenosum]